MEVQAQLGQMALETSIPKIIRANWTGGVPQAVERLLCECEALSSNHSPTPKKKQVVRLYHIPM
jgi:hypothetical protein